MIKKYYSPRLILILFFIAVLCWAGYDKPVSDKFAIFNVFGPFASIMLDTVTLVASFIISLGVFWVIARLKIY